MDGRKISIFQGKSIRRHWDNKKELWYFSVVDVIRVLTNSVDALAYWRKLKERLLKEGGNETVTKCHGLKMIAADNKMRLTDEWEKRGVKEEIEFAILTDEISQAWAGLTTKQYRNLKGLKKESLRDNMTNLELVLNMLAETATTEISQKRKPKDFVQSKRVAREGGTVAGNARKEIELKTGKKVITSKNVKNVKTLNS